METPPLPRPSWEFVEVDPSGRYGRYNEILGKGSSKTVYRAFDEYEGIEVAWNQVKMEDFLQSPEGLERLYSEIHLLKTLNHKNIMRFYTSWVDPSNRNINFVTEMFTSGTLRQYRHKYRKVNMRAVKNWCRQILEGLLYLHSQEPPIIHRDLKCDNIFINGNQGEVKIGDLGLAAVLRTSPAAHCVGTPEFMAPEVYDERYNELVDIYSFGMCVLEMVTFEYPYSECNHPIEIYKKVTSGKKPEALYKVRDPEVRQFVDKCLAAVSHRLPASELLKDPFLMMDDVLGPNSSSAPGPSLGQPDCNEHLMVGELYDGILPEMESMWGCDDFEAAQPGTRFLHGQEYGNLLDLSITIKGKRTEDGRIFLRLRITDKDHARNIYFQFNTELDTALAVATEMVGQLDYLTNFDVIDIAEMIDGELSILVPDWRPGPGIEDIPESSTVTSRQEFTSTISSRLCIGDYLRLSKSNNNSLPSSHGGTHSQFLVNEVERSSRQSSPSLAFQLRGSAICSPLPKEKSSPSLAVQLRGSVTCSPLPKENCIAMDSQGIYSLRKTGITFLQKSSRKTKGRFLCGSFRKVSVDLSDEGSLHRSFDACEEYEAGIQERISWLKSEYDMQEKENQSDQIEQSRLLTSPDPSVSNLVADAAIPSVSSNSGMFVSLDSLQCQKEIPTQISSSNNFELPHSSRREKEEGTTGFRWRRFSNENSRHDRKCEGRGERSSVRMFAARRFIMGVLLPGCLPRTKSLKVDAINQ